MYLFGKLVVNIARKLRNRYRKLPYNQRNKYETIMSVIKRLFGEHIQSRLTRIQKRIDIQMYSI